MEEAKLCHQSEDKIAGRAVASKSSWSVLWPPFVRRISAETMTHNSCGRCILDSELLLNHNQSVTVGLELEKRRTLPIGASPGKQVIILAALLVPGYLPVSMVLLVHNFCRGMTHQQK